MEGGRRYLSKQGVFVDDVKQISLDSIGAEGTPTLILVDSSGIVKDVWVGKLPKTVEATVIDRVRQSVARQ